MGSRYEECKKCRFEYCANFSTPCIVCSKYAGGVPTINNEPTHFERKVKEIVVLGKDSTGYGAAINARGSYSVKDYIATQIIHQEYKPLRITNVIFNDPATIVFWSTGDKTIVKCAPDDEFDPEKGLAMAICKKMLGDQFYKHVFKSFVPKPKQPQEFKDFWLSKLFAMRDKSIIIETEQVCDSEALRKALDRLNKNFKRWQETEGVNDET